MIMMCVPVLCWTDVGPRLRFNVEILGSLGGSRICARKLPITSRSIRNDGVLTASGSLLLCTVFKCSNQYAGYRTLCTSE